MRKFNPVYLLVAFAAIAQGVMWVGVFSLIHPGVLSYVGGIPAGGAIVGLVVYSANALPRVQAKRARQGGWVMLVLTIIAEPVVLGVVNWWSMPADFRAVAGSYIVAGGASLIISLVLVMGALVDRSLLPASKPKEEGNDAQVSGKGKGKTGKKDVKPAKVARKAVKDDELLSYFQGNPGASDTQAAEYFGITRQAVGQRRKKLYQVQDEIAQGKL